MEISDDASEILVTYSIGSCIGVTMFDPVVRVGGMVHCMLPSCKLDPEKATENPALFVDTAIPELYDRVTRCGAGKSRLVVTLAGAARIIQGHGMFRIEERNLRACEEFFAQNDISIRKSCTGGYEGRTIFLNMSNGNFTVRCGGKDEVYELSE